jgi:hypothetical protein
MAKVESNYSDIFVAKLDTLNGQPSFSYCSEVLPIPDRTRAQGRAIAVDDDNNVIVVGVYELRKHYYLFLTKFQVSNNSPSRYNFGVTASDISKIKVRVVVDKSKNVILVCYSDGIIDFGGGNPNQSNNSSALYVTKFDEQGKLVWSSSFPGNYTDFRIAIDSCNNLVITGYFTDTVNFGCGDLGVKEKSSFFNAKFDVDGKCFWSCHFQGDFFGCALALDSQNNLVATATGGIKSPSPFIFVAKFKEVQLDSLVRIEPKDGEVTDLKWVCNRSIQYWPSQQSIPQFGTIQVILGPGEGLGLASKVMGVVRDSTILGRMILMCDQPYPLSLQSAELSLSKDIESNQSLHIQSNSVCSLVSKLGVNATATYNVLTVVDNLFEFADNSLLSNTIAMHGNHFKGTTRDTDIAVICLSNSGIFVGNWAPNPKALILHNLADKDKEAVANHLTLTMIQKVK